MFKSQVTATLLQQLQEESWLAPCAPFAGWSFIYHTVIWSLWSCYVILYDHNHIIYHCYYYNLRHLQGALRALLFHSHTSIISIIIIIIVYILITFIIMIHDYHWLHLWGTLKITKSINVDFPLKIIASINVNFHLKKFAVKVLTSCFRCCASPCRSPS